MLALAVAGLALAPIHRGVQMAAILFVVLASLLSWRLVSREHHWSTIFWSGENDLQLLGNEVAATARAKWTGRAWRSAKLCVVRVETANGNRFDLLLFACRQSPGDWRRLQARLNAGGGQADTSRIVC
jgi:hypothetical protein